MEVFYPDIDETVIWKINIAKEHAVEDPDYLKRPECPYSATVKNFLGAKPSTDPASASVADGEVTIRQESERLLRELKAFGSQLDVEDIAERSAYFRLSTTLIERLLKVLERSAQVEAVTEFENKILEFIEDELTPDQRTRLMDRLK